MRRPDGPRIRHVSRRKLRKHELITERGCYTPRQLRLVTRRFPTSTWRRWRLGGKLKVRLQPQAMEHLIRAYEDSDRSLRVAPWPTSSYRTRAQQAELYERYQAGGPLAAPPCVGWHNAGLAIDLWYATARERDKMKGRGFNDLMPADPPHFTFRVTG